MEFNSGFKGLKEKYVGGSLKNVGLLLRHVGSGAMRCFDCTWRMLTQSECDCVVMPPSEWQCCDSFNVWLHHR